MGEEPTYSVLAAMEVARMDSRKALVLRTCNADLTSHSGFRWPESGPVECIDWTHEAHCGGGLHGLLWGEGDGKLLDWSEAARWLVVEIDAAEAVDLGGKIKFPRGVVVHCGDRASATAYIANNGGAGRAIVGGTATAGNCGTATAGYGGTATAGDYGTATAGKFGTATAGNCGTATAGDYGTATAGNRGTATAGKFGTATAGDYGTATAGNRGTATAGYGGALSVEYYDRSAERYRRRIAEIDGKLFLAGVAYALDGDGNWIRKEDRK